MFQRLALAYGDLASETELLREVINLQNICNADSSSNQLHHHQNSQDYLMSLLTAQARESLTLKDIRLRDLQSQCDMQATIIDDLLKGFTPPHSPALLVRTDLLDLLLKSTLGLNNDPSLTQQSCDRLLTAILYNTTSTNTTLQQRHLIEEEILRNLGQRAEMTE